MTIARVTSKGQITIPVEIRKDLEIQAGDRLHFEKVEDGKVSVHVIHQRRLVDLAGSLPVTKPMPGKAELREIVGKKIGQKIAEEGL